MIKVGIADYGLNVWYGNMHDYEWRLKMLKELNFDGIERLEAATAERALEYNALARKLGMDFVTCRGTNAADTLTFSAGLNKEYIWVQSNATDFDTFYRHANHQAEVAAQYGLKVGIHNHLGTPVETEEQLEKFLARCPDCYIVFDIGHHHGAGGDPLYIVEKYFDRLVTVHFKDYVIKDPDATVWSSRLRFCELGGGVMGDIPAKVAKLLQDKGYNGWVMVEHDTHLRDPRIDLKISRDYLKDCGI
ncbi:MAG: TIM barrel protein [Clostridia bacterium]|nr:TIM barrel protein [Clostridia bacterium]